MVRAGALVAGTTLMVGALAVRARSEPPTNAVGRERASTQPIGSVLPAVDCSSLPSSPPGSFEVLAGEATPPPPGMTLLEACFRDCRVASQFVSGVHNEFEERRCREQTQACQREALGKRFTSAVLVEPSTYD